MELVQKNKVNMTIGFFASLPPRDNIMKSSFAYFTTNLVWIVPPGQPHSALQKLLNPMDLTIWTIFGITFAIAVVVITYLKFQPKNIQNFVFGRKIQSPGMNFINIVLGNSLHILPSRNFSRFLFVIFTFYCFILRSSYLGGLVKFMQLDTRYPRMMTTQQLLDNNFKFYMLYSSLAYLDEMPLIQSHAELISYEEYNDQLKNIYDSSFKGVFLTSLAHLAYRNMKNYPEFFYYAPESVYTVNIVIYFQIDSCLKSAFDRVLGSLVCSGLINKWASTWIDRKYLQPPPNNNIQTLNLNQLKGAFELLIGGLILATIAFTFEIIFHKVKNILKHFFP